MVIFLWTVSFGFAPPFLSQKPLGPALFVSEPKRSVESSLGGGGTKVGGSLSRDGTGTSPLGGSTFKIYRSDFFYKFITQKSRWSHDFLLSKIFICER